MLEVSVIDTLRFARRLEAAGVEPGQAEAMTHALNDELGGRVATSDDLDRTADGLKGEITRLESALKGDMVQLESGLKGDMVQLESGLKEDMARLESGLKEDMARLEGGLKGDMVRLEGELKGDMARLEGELKGDMARLESELKGDIAKVDGRVDTLHAKFDALAGKFETQGRYVFLVLALIAALGLYNAVLPPLASREPRAASIEPVVPKAPADAGSTGKPP